MRVEVKSVEPIPSDSEDPDFQWYRFLVGPAGRDGSESVDILFCTPAWIADQVEASGVLFPRYLVVGATPRSPELIRIVTERLESITGASWQEIGPLLSAIGHWEFEGYREA